jgi:hypothetical protein
VSLQGILEKLAPDFSVNLVHERQGQVRISSNDDLAVLATNCETEHELVDDLTKVCGVVIAVLVNVKKSSQFST